MVDQFNRGSTLNYYILDKRINYFLLFWITVHSEEFPGTLQTILVVSRGLLAARPEIFLTRLVDSSLVLSKVGSGSKNINALMVAKVAVTSPFLYWTFGACVLFFSDISKKISQKISKTKDCKACL